MTLQTTIFKAAILFFLSSTILPQEPDFFKITTKRLSERAVVISGTQFNTNQILLKSEKGLILIDTGISPEFAREIKKVALKEFNTNHFTFVINTHYHWDHVQGNQVFTDALIVAHKNCAVHMRRQNSTKRPVRITQNEKPEGNPKSGTIPPPPPSHILIDGTAGYSLKTPDIGFSNHLTIDAGDLTLYLLWYGEGHTNNDIIIYCPEEAVLAVGDLFYKKSLPPFNQEMNLDVPKWLQTLDWILDETRSIRTVVPGHNELFSREDLILYRNYISILWEETGKAVSDGYSLQETQKKFDLKRRFPALQKRDNVGNNGGSLHKGNVEAIWRQQKKIK